jgi:acyl carrier protein
MEDVKKMLISERIIEMMHEQLSMSNQKLVTTIDSDTVLLETGLDSLSFATIIVLLEQEYGIDPFTARSEAIYPRTFGEFVDLYTEELQRKGQRAGLQMNAE